MGGRTQSALQVRAGQAWLSKDGRRLVEVTWAQDDQVDYRRVAGPGRWHSRISAYTLVDRFRLVELNQDEAAS